MAPTVNDIRTRADVVRYLTESSPEWDHDVTNSWDAVAILLFSAAMLRTTVPSILAKFTGYDLGFICAVAWNMRNNHLWTATQYKPQNWSLEERIDDSSDFWEEVDAGCGTLWFGGAESELSVAADMMSFAPHQKDRTSELESEKTPPGRQSASVH